MAKGLIQKALVYMGGGMARRAAPLILLPVLTRYLSPESYGLVATFQVILALAVPFAGINASAAVTRAWFDLDRMRFAAYMGTSLGILACGTLGLYGVLALFDRTLGRVLDFPAPWLWVVPLAAAGQVLMNLATAVLRVRERAFWFSAFNLGSTLVNLGASLWLVVGLDWDWQGRVAGIVVGPVLFGLVGLLGLFAYGFARAKWSKTHAKDILGMGLPLIPHSLGLWAKTMASRLVINNMAGLAATGLFTVGYNVGSVISLFQAGFHQAWVPFLYERLKRNDPATDRRIVRWTYALFLANLAAGLLLAWIGNLVLPWLVGDRFMGAAPYIWWIAVGFSANGMYFLVVGYLFYEKRTGLLAWGTIITGTLNLVLCWALIRWNGPVGAAQATAASLFLGFFITWVLAQRVRPMPWLKALNIWKEEIREDEKNK